MKVIVAGSRGIIDYSYVSQILRDHEDQITEIVSGTARGVDKLGEMFAEVNNIPVTRFPADWDKNGKGAGYIRNRQMAKYADMLIAIWDKKSRGTMNMIEEMNKLKKKVFVYENFGPA